MSDLNILKCPECGGQQVTATHEQMFMINTGDHYCHSVKSIDPISKSSCLDCQWVGRRDQLLIQPGAGVT